MVIAVVVIFLGIPSDLFASKLKFPVILISVSDWRYETIVANRRNLPQIKEIRRRSMVFNRAYAASSNIAASMTSLVTGLSVVEHNVWNKHEQLLNHNNEFAGYYHEQQYPVVLFSGSATPTTLNLARGFDVAQTGVGGGLEVNKRFCDWLDQAEMNGSEQPFAAWLHYADLLPKTDGVSALRGAEYDSAVRSFDYVLGRLFEGLRRRGYSQRNSIIVIAGLAGKAADQGLAEGAICPGTVHVPLFWSTPDQRQELLVPEPISLRDVLRRLREEPAGGQHDQYAPHVLIDAMQDTMGENAVYRDGMLLVRTAGGTLRAYAGTKQIAVPEVSRRYYDEQLRQLRPHAVENPAELRARQLRCLRSFGYCN